MASEMTEPSVDIRGLTKRFGDRVVLESLDLTIRHGEFVALLGRSGSGKSTLLRVLAGLDNKTEGDATVRGAVSVVFQQPRLLPWRKVWRNVVMGLDSKRSNDRELALRALEEVRLAEHADDWPRTLSGGEAQRLSLARALVREPELLLLDEPFGALDALTRIAMQRLVEDLWQRHRPGVLLIDYLAQIARAAEQLGFEGALTPTGTWCEDAWLATAALIRETKKLKFLVAFRPGVISPTQGCFKIVCG